MTRAVTGGCLCGAIRYRIDRPVEELRACHCTHCQKASGSGASVNAIVPAAAVTFLQGTPRRYADRADSGNVLYRFFCDNCGSPIYSQRQTHPDVMVVRAGAFDNSADMKITSHIWTASARPWMPPKDGVAQYPAGLPLKT